MRRLVAHRVGVVLVAAVLSSAGCQEAASVATPTSSPATDLGADPTPAPTGDLASVRREDVQPYAMFFDSPTHGWVAGSTIESVAVALETSDAGSTWSMTGLGRGRPTVIGGLGPTLLAGRTCAFDGETVPDAACGPGVFSWVDGSWAGVSDSVLTMIAAAPDALASAEVPVDPRRDERGFPLPEIAVARHGGERGTNGSIPCDRGFLLSDLAWASPTDLVGLCEGEGMTGGSEKVLYRSTDDGIRWQPIASTKRGTLPLPGTGTRLSMAADGTGWAWAFRLGLVATTDGGLTWSSTGLADGDTVWVIGASALGGGTGWLLLHDTQDAIHLYRVGADGSLELRSTFTANAVPG